MKEKVIEIIEELYESVQEMRENGDTDLRSVLYRIESAERKIRELEDE